MKLFKKISTAVLIFVLVLGTMTFTPVISAKADGISPTNRDIVASALTHLGAGYSQGADRYGTDKYDCSGFVSQMLRSVGFYGTIPSTTASWHSMLGGKQVGDTFQLTCNRGGVATVQTFAIMAVNDSCVDVNPNSYPEGTIVLQNGHIFISLGDLSRFMTGDSESTRVNVINYLIQRYPEVDANLFYGYNGYFGNPNVYCQASEHVWKIDAGTYTGVAVRNKTVLANGSQTVDYAFRLIDGYDITFADSQVTQVDENGYTITAQVGFAYNMVRAVAYTWTEAGGPENYVCDEVPLDGTGTITYHYDISEKDNERGTYYTNLYIYDENGTRARSKQMVVVPYPQPTITKTWITDLDTTGYTVNVEFENPESVASVLMPTWTSYLGQDDIMWHEAVVEGNTASYHVTIAEHGNEGGTYRTHVYVNCLDGTQYVDTLGIDIPSSVVQKIGVLELSVPNIEQDREMIDIVANHIIQAPNQQNLIFNGVSNK